MKNKFFIFVLFLYALIIISVIAIEPSKDGKKCSAKEEFKTDIEVEEQMRGDSINWRNSIPKHKKSIGGGKLGGHGSGGSSPGSSGREGGAQNVEQNGDEKDKVDLNEEEINV
ncbi:uncharacterized protein LOC131606442 [Vicia villosa]|uniref:uncharacterized protein LOC131606442 n=1 Tax=Vicia villosa TaxID=3911 RepID=UPI00273C29D2|nr:uncharacterized protein LOC131606442 [Vicia villosa]